MLTHRSLSDPGLEKFPLQRQQVILCLNFLLNDQQFSYCFQKYHYLIGLPQCFCDWSRSILTNASSHVSFVPLEIRNLFCLVSKLSAIVSVFPTLVVLRLEKTGSNFLVFFVRKHGVRDSMGPSCGRFKKIGPFQCTAFCTI